MEQARGANPGILQIAATWLLIQALSGCYVSHLAAGQLSLVNDQQPLKLAIEAESDPQRRRLLEEVPRILSFARRFLKMNASKSYVGYYAVPRGWLTLILSAAPRDSLVPYTRWYPVAGRVPYLSFFDERRAKRAQAKLESAGYDTILHESPAYSTLGFFRDPVTSPMLDRSLPCPLAREPLELDACRLASLAETLIHELTHQHLYVAGQTDFNEQLASFVGREGMIAYLAFRGLYDEALRSRLKAAFDRQLMFAHIVAEAAKELEVLYASGVSRDIKLARREPVFARVSAHARALFPTSTRLSQPVNNAMLLQFLRYDRDSGLIQRLWQQAARRWDSFWPLVRAHAPR